MSRQALILAYTKGISFKSYDHCTVCEVQWLCRYNKSNGELNDADIFIILIFDLSKGNERADQLAGSAKIQGVLTLDSPNVVGLVRDHLASNRVEDSFTKEMLIEMGVKPGEARKCELRDPVRRCINQLMMETISLQTLRWTLKRRGEEAWSTPSS